MIGSWPPSLPPSQYEDARDSPLEQRIERAMSVKQKENSLFSLVPRGVPVSPAYQPPPVAEFEPLANPDSFADFFRLLGEATLKV